MTNFYTLFKYLQILFQFHCFAFYKYLDPLGFQELPISDANSNFVLKFNFQFLYSIINLLITFIIGNFCLVYWSNTLESNFLLTFDFLINSPRLMSHQAFPKEMWPQMDVVSNMVILFSLVTYFILCKNPYNVDRYFLKNKSSHCQNNFLMIGKHCLSVNDSKQILAFHETFFKPAFKLLLISAVFIVGFCSVFIVFINAVYEISVKEVCFWVFLFPFTLFYIEYAFCGFALFVVLSCKFVQIRQQSLITQINILTKKVAIKNEQLKNKHLTYDNSEKRKFRRQMSKVKNNNSYFWLLYTQLNGDLLHLCAHIDMTSSFWSPVLTVCFATQILTQSYFVHILFFVPTLPVAVKYLGIFFVANLLMLFFGMIQFCARIATLNNRLEKENVCFCSQIVVNIIKNSILLLIKVSY